MGIIIILIMLICEMVFSVSSNIIRYNNYVAEKWMLLIMLFYSIIWLYIVLENDGSQWIMCCIYLAGVFQGIVGIVEYMINRKIYGVKKEYIRTFEKMHLLF